MSLTPMRYKNYTWPHNPETYSISFERKIAAHKVPFGRYGMQDLGMTYRVMKGEGTFAGKNAYREFKKLASVFYEDGPGVLDHPIWQSTSAYFVELSLLEQPLDDYVHYAFEFWEDFPQETALRVIAPAEHLPQTASAAVHTVVQGDTLWAIAKKYGKSLSELIAVNPQIKNPNLIYPGEQVRLP